MSKSSREELVKETEIDPQLQKLKEVIVTETNYKSLFKSKKEIVPKALILKMVKRIQTAHLGIQSCLRRAQQLLHWRVLNQDVIGYIGRCPVCQKLKRANNEEPIPELRRGTENKILKLLNPPIDQGIQQLFRIHRHQIAGKLTATETIEHLKNCFSVHGIPEVMDESQFACREFMEFRKRWGFDHSTSSPRFPRDGGLVEKAVSTSKHIFRKCLMDGTEVQLVLLNYRNTPRNNNTVSPNQRLMSRTTRSTLQSSHANIKPTRKAEDRTARASNITPRDWKQAVVVEEMDRKAEFASKTAVLRRNTTL
ncbi:uncharacterized protein LOC135129444 [Zophobas morio]|uniref:uncharacterized protein LOC135129444 n=1 Tax=Zophobas morio TaxID=2755281 RepID=UPI00308345B3